MRAGNGATRDHQSNAADTSSRFVLVGDDISRYTNSGTTLSVACARFYSKSLQRTVSADDPAIRQAAEIIRRGGLVAFPTETVYGLGANALDREAVLRIFEAKQRPAWDPIIVHACSIEMAKTLVSAWPEAAQKLPACFMPGPLTLLLPKRDIIPDACTAGREKVGIRIPAHPVALALIEAAGVPIAAPSANRFGGTSPTTAGHVQRDLDGRIDAILDAGACAVGVESTVIDITAAAADYLSARRRQPRADRVRHRSGAASRPL